MTRLDTWLRRLFVAVIGLATVANTMHVAETGRTDDAITYVLLGVIGAGVGWYMLGGDK
jgi:hypothetical protein